MEKETNNQSGKIYTTDDDIINKKDIKKDKLSVGVISLGCDKNRVDTENMLSFLKEKGYVFTGEAENADIIIVNTCGFIASARNESYETIEEMSEYRKDKKSNCVRLIVTGCLPQKWSKELVSEFPEVDIVLGIDDYPNIASIIQTSIETNKKIVRVGNADTVSSVKDRLITTTENYAYLKIADGCDNFCTFCTIPQIRGRYRSREVDDILDEAKNLVKNGVTELVLVAQDISRYGMDKFGEPKIVNLIQKLSEIENLKWIRLLYCYPEMVTSELLNEMMTNHKLCKYLDVPLQHISNSVLKRMNRRSTKEQILEFLKNVKSLPKFVAIRTTLMTGFPGETEDDFNELCDFLTESKLLNVGFFAYSKEDGTPASSMPDQIDDKIKQKRLLKLMKLQEKIAKEENKSFIGRTIEVCCEGVDYDKQMFYGRSEYQAPDVDSIVFFKSKEPVMQGVYYKIKIKSVSGYDLKGEVVYE